MNEIVWVALITGITGLGGGIFGPVLTESWRIKREIAKERYEARERQRAERFARAEALSLAILDAVEMGDASWFSDVEKARIQFVAVLGPGEGQAATYIRDVTHGLGRQRSDQRQDVALDAVEHLFGWLRGDVPLKDLVTLT